MTQEDKDLLLRDLFARLPYNVKVQYKNNICSIDTYTEVNKFLLIDEKRNEYPSIKDKLFLGIEEFKPYLFPLSSMTEEQKKEISKRYNLHTSYGLCIKIHNYTKSYWQNDSCHLQDYLWLVDWFNKKHFDYRGLIEKGLAKDVSGLNIY